MKNLNKIKKIFIKHKFLIILLFIILIFIIICILNNNNLSKQKEHFEYDIDICNSSDCDPDNLIKDKTKTNLKKVTLKGKNNIPYNRWYKNCSEYALFNEDNDDDHIEDTEDGKRVVRCKYRVYNNNNKFLYHYLGNRTFLDYDEEGSCEECERDQYHCKSYKPIWYKPTE